MNSMINTCTGCIVDDKVYQFIITNWDEMLGPVVVKNSGNLFFDFDVQGLIENFFMTATTIYGNQLIISEPTFIKLPVKYLEMETLIYFTSIPDEKARAGQKFIMLVLVARKFCKISVSELELIIEYQYSEFLKNQDIDKLNDFIIKDLNYFIENESHRM